MSAPSDPSRPELLGVALVSATLLMIELALTRIFSVIMYYHFAFLAVSIALFGLSASGVFAYIARRRLSRFATSPLLSSASLVYAACAIVSLFALVRLRVGLNYSPANLALMLTIYLLAALPFFTGGFVITMAVSRLTPRINSVYAADLLGAAAGCVILIPLLDQLGAPGVVLAAAVMAIGAATLFAAEQARQRAAAAGALLLVLPLAGQATGVAGFDVVDTKGHKGDRVLFAKWNSFSRIGVYERTHGDWSLSDVYRGPLPETRYMDIDSAASTPILRLAPDLSNVQYLRYELTALAYHLVEPGSGFKALVIGPGGGRDLVSALVFGAGQVDGVEINPIIADDVMRGQFHDFSGGIYTHPRIRITVDDGRSFVRRSAERYDFIQASLVDTWAATAAGAYTLTENTLYTVEAFNDYLNHLTDRGLLTITRWVFDGLRLVSLARAAAEMHGWSAADRIAIVRHGRVATFLFKKTPFSQSEVSRLRDVARRLGFDVLYAPGGDENGEPVASEWVDGAATGDYARLIHATDLQQFYASLDTDVRPTTDDRPFFFHTTKLQNQFAVAFGRSMLFGNGLSALLTLLGISAALVVILVLGPLALATRDAERPRGWFLWLVYFGALGAGFMLIEVAVLQQFVLLLGHPVYSLTVTLFSLLLGTGLGAAWSRRFRQHTLPRAGAAALVVIAAVGVGLTSGIAPLVAWAMPLSRPVRMAVAIATLLPIGLVLGIPMPAGLRLLGSRVPEMVPWAWGMNGAWSVLGATLAIFIAMNWGFHTTLLAAAATYLVGLAAFCGAAGRSPRETPPVGAGL
jgi:hypothetical protein